MIIAPYVGLGRHELGRLGRPCRQTEPPRSAPSRYGASASAHLQWGHRLSAMETSSPALPVCCLFAAPSMGPPPFGDGNVQSRAARLLSICCPFNEATAFRRWKRPVPRCPFAVYLLPLQWGHRLSAMETSSPALPVCCLFAAPSMRPPPFGDGNVQSRAARLLSICCPFNGATAFRRWKRPVPRCPFACLFAAPSMRPPPFGDGNVQSRAARLLSICCPFNGATAFRRWKRPVDALPVCCLFAAPSMRPPPFGDGNVQSRAARLLSICCPFNGATAFRRWKLGRN